MTLSLDCERWATSDELGPMQAAALIIGAAPDRQALMACRDLLSGREDERSHDLRSILDQVLTSGD